MYAVIKIGGKQYRVEQGQKLLVDRQPHAAGEAFTPDVLMTGGDEVVTDREKLQGAVSVQVVEHLRGEKIKVFTFKPKRGFKKTRGHRSELTRISVESIGGAARPKRAPARKAEAEPAEVRDGRAEGRGPGAGQAAGGRQATRGGQAEGRERRAGRRTGREAAADEGEEGGRGRWRIRRGSDRRRTGATRTRSDWASRCSPARRSPRARSSSASAARASTRVPVRAWAATTRCSPPSTARSSSGSARAGATSACRPAEPAA